MPIVSRYAQRVTELQRVIELDPKNQIPDRDGVKVAGIIGGRTERMTQCTEAATTWPIASPLLNPTHCDLNGIHGLPVFPHV